MNDLLARQLSGILNTASRENASDTPDFILAEYMLNALAIFERATIQRDNWYGRLKDETTCEGGC